MSSFEDMLRRAIALDLPYSERPRALRARPAAVLALFGGTERPAPAGDLSILLIRRTETLDHHRGQMALPGGMQDHLADGTREDPETAALRETEEEVAIPRNEIRVIGSLPALATPTGFEIHPVVGVLARPISEIALQPNASEIAEALWVSLATLRSDGIYRAELFEAGPLRFTNHVFQVGPHRVWGATGAMIRNLLDRLG